MVSPGPISAVSNPAFGNPRDPNGVGLQFFHTNSSGFLSMNREALYVNRTLPFIAFASVEKFEGRLTRMCRSCSRISSRMMTSH